MKRNRSYDEVKFTELKKKLQGLKLLELQKLSESLGLRKNCRKDELRERILNLYDGTDDHIIDKIEEILGSSNHLMPSTTMPNPVVPPKKLKSESSVSEQKLTKLKKNPFYNELCVLMPPTELQSSDNTKGQKQSFNFKLTDDQSNQICKNRIFHSTSAEYTVQVQLRLCLLDPTTEQNDLYPQNLEIRVNNKICQLPHFLPARPNTIPKRPSKPLNITPFVKTSSSSTNVIEVRWQKEAKKTFAITCLLVKQLKADDLFLKLKFNNADNTRQMIKDKLKEIDSEIATTMLHISLNCPLGRTRMIHPCRASTCNHLQCFDAHLYLKMNELKQSWICPVCGKEALFDNLVIDRYFLNVIKSVDQSVSEIQLNSDDGSWSRMSAENKIKKEEEDGFVISDDEDINNNGSVPEKAMVIKKPNNISSSSETIDLTLDD